MTNYEAVIIFTPIYSEADLKKEIKKYTSLIKENGGEIVHEENWGLKQLAYSIDKKTTGIYYLVEYQAEGKFNEIFETQMKRDDGIMRWLLTALDKDAVEYTIRRRKRLAAEAKNEKKEAEKVNEEA